MTREEAKEVLYALLGYFIRTSCEEDISKQTTAIRMAIEALKEMSAEEYRQRLMEVFHRTDHDELLTYVVMPKEEEFKSLEYILRQYKFEPRPHGEWKYNPDCVNDEMQAEFYCSICNHAAYSRLDNFCSHCGAKMVKEEGDEK